MFKLNFAEIFGGLSSFLVLSFFNLNNYILTPITKKGPRCPCRFSAVFIVFINPEFILG